MPESTSDSSSRTLRLRVVSALIAAPLAIGAIFWLPPVPFALVFLALAGLAADEWGRLAGLTHVAQRTAYLTVFAVVCWGLTTLHNGPFMALAVISVGWLGAFGIVVGYPASGAVLRGRPMRLAIGLLVLVGAWLALVELRALPAGSELILWLFIVVWSADIGAYFAGRALGRRKLAPNVSPGKTWEGAIGGLLAATVLATGMAAAVPALAGANDGAGALGTWLALALFLGAVSIVGDLFESVLKRESGAKDSGGLLPGHGGLLDRIDALVAALPIFALLMLVFA